MVSNHHDAEVDVFLEHVHDVVVVVVDSDVVDVVDVGD